MEENSIEPYRRMSNRLLVEEWVRREAAMHHPQIAIKPKAGKKKIKARKIRRISLSSRKKNRKQ